MDFLEMVNRGGPAMWPLALLSIMALSTIIERLWFWWKVVQNSRRVQDKILDAAHYQWQVVSEVARTCDKHPLGRFLYAPLRQECTDPEVFHLALEAAADEELALMRRGEKLLEAVIALSPLLGLLGTVLGLISSLGSIQLSDLGTDSTAGVTLGIGESLISTASGLIVAIVSLAFYRLFQAFSSNQVRLFRQAGSELEILYRENFVDGLPITTLPPEMARDRQIKDMKMPVAKDVEEAETTMDIKTDPEPAIENTETEPDQKLENEAITPVGSAGDSDE